jgi:membrane-bound ClpP family serine protease
MKRLVASTGRATCNVTESTGPVLVNSEEYSTKTSREILQKGTVVRVTEADVLTLFVEKA